MTEHKPVAAFVPKEASKVEVYGSLIATVVDGEVVRWTFTPTMDGNVDLWDGPEMDFHNTDGRPGAFWTAVQQHLAANATDAYTTPFTVNWEE